MPLYEYEHDTPPTRKCSARFEFLQAVGSPPLAECPTCGGACHRVVSAFATAPSTKAGRSGKADLSPNRLEKLGFTQYRRTKKGQYEKTCGDGPSTIHRDS
jgi:putative FmdB family regulatory protein